MSPLGRDWHMGQREPYTCPKASTIGILGKIFDALKPGGQCADIARRILSS